MKTHKHTHKLVGIDYFLRNIINIAFSSSQSNLIEMRDDESERKVYDDRSFPRVYFSFTVLSPVRCAISKHKYRFIMEMRTNLTREKSNTFPSLLIKFLLVINVYFSIFLARRKHWESSIKESEKKSSPAKGEIFLLFMLKWLLLVLRKGAIEKRKFLGIVLFRVSQIQCLKGKQKILLPFKRFKRLTWNRKCFEGSNRFSILITFEKRRERKR